MELCLGKYYGIIYKITNKINGKIYIGQTCGKNGFESRYSYNGKGIERVYKFYKNSKSRGIGYNKHLLNSIEKYGFENFEIEEIFDTANSKFELDMKEIYYIDYYNSTNDKYGYNEEFGGSRGIPSIETREKMSKNHADINGENNPFYGKHHSKENKEKISKANSGEKNGMYGRVYTEEERKQMSEAKKGEKSCWYGKKGKEHPKSGTKLNQESRDKIRDNHGFAMGVALIDLKDSSIKYFNSRLQCGSYLIKLLNLNIKRIEIQRFIDTKLYKKRFIIASTDKDKQIQNIDYVNQYFNINDLKRIV